MYLLFFFFIFSNLARGLMQSYSFIQMKLRVVSPPPHFYLIKYIFPDLYMKYITDYFKSYFFKIMPMHVSLCLRKCFKN